MPPAPELAQALQDLARSYRIRDKGALCVALVVTRHAKKHGLPLDPASLLTENRGQVKGLGKGAVQAILADYAITRTLAEEGGRTSRGSIANMERCVSFLNACHQRGVADVDEIEAWWIARVKDYFASKPFVLRHDVAKSLRAIIRDLLAQAQTRERESPGATCAGTMLQHLVGARLTLALGAQVQTHGASVADTPSGRDADFLIHDTAIHSTTAPGEALMRKCAANLDAGLRPVLVTVEKGVPVAEGLAEQKGIADRIDVFEAGQFIAASVYDLGRFAPGGRRQALEDLIAAYNTIVDACETDPGLRIQLAAC